MKKIEFDIKAAIKAAEASESEDEDKKPDKPAKRFNKAMNNKKWAYYEATVADFYFSLDKNRNGDFDENEMRESVNFWSGSDKRK